MSTEHFQDFKIAVQRQFNKMQEHNLYSVQIDKDKLWDLYLKSFPEGTNPLFRERAEHDCSCCRHFIKAIGNIVAIKDGKLISLWDFKINNFYQVVIDALSTYVKSCAIENIFLHYEKSVGTDKNFELFELDGQKTKTWEHFYLQLPNKVICNKKDIGTKLSEARAFHDVFLRALNEITDDSINTVQDLIAQNSLYRGTEKKNLINAFQLFKRNFTKLKTEREKELFVWNTVISPDSWICKVRNDVIGTLLVDLSEGKDLEVAVKCFEDKVSGTNYKRTSALITPKMKEAAKAKLTELGLMSSLERRYATLEDINISNIIFADRDAKKRMAGDIFDELQTSNKAVKKSLNKVEEIPIEKFITDIIPSAKSIEVFIENNHERNLVSLIAPYDLTAKGIFKWPNPFSWSYKGDVADSIKERVKKAGGSVEGDVCCRLAWNNTDDLDLHMVERTNVTYEIYYGCKRHSSPNGGILDIDANGGDGLMPNPCENIYYKTKSKMQPGVYILFVQQYMKRETANIGFDIEIDIEGKVYNFSHDKSLRTDDRVNIAEITVDVQHNITVKPILESSQSVKKIWNVDTNNFHKVQTMMFSPNFWDGKEVGNKHYFFMLENCINSDKARGFYNEFLISELEPYRKTMELVGAAVRTEESENQLSGLGFSSTQRASLLCRVSGSFNRVIKIIF